MGNGTTGPLWRLATSALLSVALAFGGAPAPALASEAEPARSAEAGKAGADATAPGNGDVPEPAAGEGAQGQSQAQGPLGGAEGAVDAPGAVTSGASESGDTRVVDSPGFDAGRGNKAAGDGAAEEARPEEAAAAEAAAEEAAAVEEVSPAARPDAAAEEGEVRAEAASLSGASISAIGTQAYTGKAVCPRPAVRLGGRTLRLNADYTLSYRNNVRAGTATVTATGRGNYAGSKSATFRISTASVSYRTHVQNVGWQGWRANGKTSGTSGRGLRLEGINIKLGGSRAAGSIQYRTHVQNVGWQGWRADGNMSGTSGRSLRLEGIQIRLTGQMASAYDVWYRVHAQNFGWMGWAKNGAQAGTAGYGYRLEAIQIRLVAKGGKAPGSTANAFRDKTPKPLVISGTGWKIELPASWRGKTVTRKGRSTYVGIDYKGCRTLLAYEVITKAEFNKRMQDARRYSVLNDSYKGTKKIKTGQIAQRRFFTGDSGNGDWYLKIELKNGRLLLIHGADVGLPGYFTAKEPANQYLNLATFGKIKTASAFYSYLRKGMANKVGEFSIDGLAGRVSVY